MEIVLMDMRERDLTIKGQDIQTGIEAQVKMEAKRRLGESPAESQRLAAQVEADVQFVRTQT